MNRGPRALEHGKEAEKCPLTLSDCKVRGEKLIEKRLLRNCAGLDDLWRHVYPKKSIGNIPKGVGFTRIRRDVEYPTEDVLGVVEKMYSDDVHQGGASIGFLDCP